MKYRVDYYEELIDISNSEEFISDDKKYIGSSAIESDLNLDDFILELKKDEEGVYVSDGYEIESTEYKGIGLTIVEVVDFFGHFTNIIDVNKKIGKTFEFSDEFFNDELDLESYLFIEDFSELDENQIKELLINFPNLSITASYQKEYEWGASGFWEALVISGTVQVIINAVKYLKNRGVESISIDDEELKIIKVYLYKHGFLGKKYTFRCGGIKELNGKKIYKLTDGKFNIDITIANGIILEVESFKIKWN